MNNSNKKIRQTAKKIIPGGNSLLSKRAEMFAPDIWPTYFKKANGIKVTDLNDNDYIDFTHFGVGTNILGYSNPEVNDAVKQCIDSGNICTLNPPEEVFVAEKLLSMHKWSGGAKFARTGGEANSIAVRIARNFTKKSKILFCGYHGWHDWYLSANISDSKNLDNQLLKGLSSTGVPRELKDTAIPFMLNDLEQVRKKIQGSDIAAVKMEVMRNNYPDVEVLRELRKITQDNGVLLIFDECTSGFRESFGGLHLNYEVNPDIAVFGKALSNGFSLTSVIGTKEVMQEAETTFISSTYFTEKTPYVAALKTLQLMEEKKSWEIITDYGKYFRDALRKAVMKNDFDIEFSGMFALSTFKISFKDEASFMDKNQSTFLKTLITQEMLNHGYLFSNIFYPSILHTEDEIDKCIDCLNSVLMKIRKQKKLEKMLRTSLCHSTFERLN